MVQALFYFSSLHVLLAVFVPISSRTTSSPLMSYKCCILMETPIQEILVCIISVAAGSWC